MESAAASSDYGAVSGALSGGESRDSKAVPSQNGTSKAVLKNDFSSAEYSVLESQVGYSIYGFKAVYLRSTVNPGKGSYYADFDLVRKSDNAVVYRGKAYYWGEKWQSYWWTADFTQFEVPGVYFIRFNGKKEDLRSSDFKIGGRLLTDESIQMVLFDQLDRRRSAGKLGWRDSSTDELREIQANIIAIHTLCDVYDNYYASLSSENKAKLIDNIKFGCNYLLALQEKTDDPLTNGRFKHDLYKTKYSAPLIRNWHDTAYALTALARSYGIMKKHDANAAASYKSAFELSYALCVRRPYYLDSEFTLEVETGRLATTNAAKVRYGIISMLWEFPNELRTRDRLTFMKACTEMYKSTGDKKYLAKAREFGRLVADRQYTDYTKAIDGCYGMFREFDNNENAFMLDWLQSFGQNLGCIQPTDLEPFIDLIKYDPDGADTARWHNVVHTFIEGYVKRSSVLTPLGIYPIGAYNDPKHGGVKFFQSMSHGANNLYGMMGRNMLILGAFANESALQHLAQRNLQFVIGLNPGFPNAYKETSWASYSFIYGLGKRSYKGFYGPKSTYTPPLGSGINGFTAAPQFSERRISDDPDLPKGIIDSNGNKQFNEDYLPHSMGYMSAALMTETPYALSLTVKNSGAPVDADVTVTVNGKRIKAYKTGSGGKLVIKDLPLGVRADVSVSYNGVSVTREFGTVGAGSAEWDIDFSKYVDIKVSAPSQVTSNGAKLTVTLTNMSRQAVSVKLSLSADGVSLGGTSFKESLSAGQKKTVAVTVKSRGATMPYTVLVKADCGGCTSITAASGLAK